MGSGNDFLTVNVRLRSQQACIQPPKQYRSFMPNTQRIEKADAPRSQVPPQAGHRRQVGEIFTSAEILSLTRRSDWRGLWAVGSTWGVIAVAFAVMAWASHQLPTWAVVVTV